MSGPKLSEAYAAWKAGSPAKGARKPTANTILEADAVVQRFTELHGDLPLGGMGKDEVRAFLRDAMARVPRHLSPAQHRLTLRELATMTFPDDKPRRHVNTVNKLLTILSTVITRAMDEGHMDGVPGYVNPVRGLKLPVNERTAAARRQFSQADLAAVFGSPIYARQERPRTGGGEATYWLPLLALLTPMRGAARVGEAASALRANRRAVSVLAAGLQGWAAWRRDQNAATVRAVLDALAPDPALAGLCAELAASSLPAGALRDWLVGAAGTLHAGALPRAVLALEVPAGRRPEELGAIEAALARAADERLRRLALAALRGAAEGLRLGWTAERLARLEAFRADASPLVAEAPGFTFPPGEGAPATARRLRRGGTRA